MCIAVYKPMGEKFPNKKTLERCFKRNPDGAGFMVADGEKVIIKKGYMGFRSFWKALRNARAEYGEDKAYVMHFRISTQGGVRQDGCHPFPLSENMNDLRRLDSECSIGIAHNGIIDLCSSRRGNVTYSDTMEFITEYLSLIIQSTDYYKNKASIKLIEKLCGSRLAILDGTGHCELIGYGWEENGRVWYSNDSYEEYRPSFTMGTFPLPYDWDDGFTKNSAEMDCYDWEDYFDEFFDNNKGGYEFEPGACPIDYIGDASYCDFCMNYKACCESCKA